jgi:hypothetical protein
MGYAIVQKELVVPNIELLTRAFCTLPELTSIDAQNAANDAYGILLRGLDGERAGVLQAALTHEGIETEMIRETELPNLSTPRIIRQVEFTPEHLAAHDPMQRVTRIPWSDLSLIAAGRVIWRQVRRLSGSLDEQAHAGSLISEAASTSRVREEEQERLVIDLFLTDRTTRFSIIATEFNFGHLGQRLSEDVGINHLFLVQELEEHAPHASLNQGAFKACQKPPEHFTYPSRQAYQEELVWMLWQIGRLTGGGGGAAPNLAPTP